MMKQTIFLIKHVIEEMRSDMLPEQGFVQRLYQRSRNGRGQVVRAKLGSAGCTEHKITRHRCIERELRRTLSRRRVETESVRGGRYQPYDHAARSTPTPFVCCNNIVVVRGVMRTVFRLMIFERIFKTDRLTDRFVGVDRGLKVRVLHRGSHTLRRRGVYETRRTTAHGIYRLERSKRFRQRRNRLLQIVKHLLRQRRQAP